jgi:hypothetical protein
MGERTADSLLMSAPGISADFADRLIPNVVVELDPDVADRYGAFKETALGDAAAWDANGDLDLS